MFDAQKESLMKRNILKSLVALSTLSLGSSALADGFSASFDAPIFQGNQFNFSVGASLNYSIEVAPRIFVGASLSPNFVINPNTGVGTFALGSRVGAKYVASIVKTSSLFVDVPIGIGVDVLILPNISVAADINAGVNVNYVIQPNLKVLAAASGKLGYDFTAGSLLYAANGTVGLFFEPVKSVELFARGEVGANGTFNSAASTTYSLVGGVYYTFVPQFKLGLYVGYNNSFSNVFTNGGFVVGLRGLIALKPGSLGIEGAFKP
jgi:hypothetical protein